MMNTVHLPAAIVREADPLAELVAEVANTVW